ncbi:hypothetical protein GCM10023149_45110 [Mucilaginibacter gynuensis]|uniref:HTH araC/xylS-type domain-containing protein n=1 Tax=Mucilaginibacter gynuensis TaxID=1302236 RepID=A0ABP8H9U0_9SPHI
MTETLGIDIGLNTYFPHWGWLPLQFSLATGPLIFFYVLKITRPEYKFRGKDLLHFSPLLLELGAHVLAVKESMKTGGATYNTHTFQQLNLVLQFLAFFSVSIYLCLCFIQIERFYRQLKFNWGDRPRNELQWLRNLLLTFGLVWLLWIPFAAADYFYCHNQPGAHPYYLLHLLLAVVSIGMGAVVFLRPGDNVQADAPLFLKSLIPAELRQKGIWLKNTMKVNRYYQDPELNLSLLAEKLDMSPHELSRIINTALQKSFNDFISEYRVAEVIRKMQDPANDHITLLGIAYDSGFNSKSTFNRIFKEMTGKSPAEYKIELKKEFPTYNMGRNGRFATVVSGNQSTLKWTASKFNYNFMFRNYLKTAFRGFWKHKLFTIINIADLSIGISASVVIYLIVNYDFTFDKFHKDNDRICRVVMDMELSNGQKIHSSGVPGPLAGAIKNQVTGIEATVPIYEFWPHFVYINNKQKRFKDQNGMTFTAQQYFKAFNYVWLAGSRQHALDEPNQVVLTSQQARLYFPALKYKDMIGKTVTYDTLTTTVSGIVQTLTQNTDFAFHGFVSISTITTNKSFAASSHITNWGHIFSGSEVFVKLMPGISAAKVLKQMNTLYKENNPPPRDDRALANNVNLRLQPLDDLHFNADYNIFSFSSPANKTADYGLLAIAGFLLLLACINFVNLTTAQAGQRAKEIGIRKTMGGTRAQLIVQFLSETFLITLFAVVISVLLAPVILNLFSDFILPDIRVDFLHQPEIMLFLLILTVVVTVLSGFYPALMLSGYKPVSVLKKQAQSDSSKTRHAWLRKSLTVSQFVVAQFFIMATVLVSRQIHYVLNKELGFKKDAILVVNAPWKAATLRDNKALLNSFQSIPGVALVGLGSDPPSSDVFNRTRSVYNAGKKEIVTEEIVVKTGDENFIKTYQLKLLAGRNILESDTGKAIIINNTYAKLLGFKHPGDAIGKQLDKFSGRRNISIIGVVADFNQRSLHSPIYPSAISWGSEKYGEMRTLHVSLKPQTADGNEWKTTIARMAKAWKKVYPDDDFDCQFYDETIAQFYEEEQHTSTLLTWATGLSIFISCLGLLGLAIYTTNQRAKEIGIRKVLGATVTQILTLLSTELVWLILLAFILVTPVAWYAMNKWMESFVDHVAISWWVFVISGAGMLVTALFTLSFQTLRAAIANPVKSLRSE